MIGVVVPLGTLRHDAMLSIEKCLTFNAMHASLLCPFALGFAQAGTVRRRLYIVVHVCNVVAGLSLRTAYAGSGLSVVKIAGEVSKNHIADKHVRGARSCSVVAAVLSDDTPVLCTMHGEIAEEHVADIAPSPAAWQEVAFVISIASRDKLSDPCLDVYGITNVALSAAFDDRGLIDLNIGDAGILEVLAQRSNGDTIATHTSDIAN